jgi:cyclopropane-fatty-acyl-phospholipid synthase
MLLKKWPESGFMKESLSMGCANKTATAGGAQGMLLTWGLNKIVAEGELTLIDANGRRHVHGGGNGPSCTVRLHDKSLHRKLVTNPWLYLGEAYMDGTLTIEEGTLDDCLGIVCRNASTAGNLPLYRMMKWLGYRTRWLQQNNPIGRARDNVAHHYDLTDTLYDLFLDSDRQYSCAYFMTPGDSLETAQENKKRHLAAKLLLKPGQKVLDIGSGWGGLAMYLAKTADVEVTGVTLSVEQHRYAEARAAEAGLSDRVRFKLEDYRLQTDRYDRIVSVGMFEHVGAKHYREFFAKTRDLLTDDGVAVLHSIGRMDPPGTTSAWIRKYIFPGGYTPAMSETLAALELEDLYVTDIEVLRLHYAETLRHWYSRFQANRDKVEAIYDERFCRMWEFYLKACEMSFRYWDQMVFQIQFGRHQDAVPLVRDYITDWERANWDAGGKPAKDAKDEGIAA